MEVGKYLGGLHPVLVHFPIVLLFLAVGSDCLALWRRDQRLSWAGLWLTLIGTASAMITFVCGILAEVFAARSGVPLEPMEAHERIATLATWLFLALAVWRLFMGAAPRRRVHAAYLALALSGCALLGLAAHRGGEAVYQYGANVASAQAAMLPSGEDLATVAQHQDEETLQYSNQMHWIFGWIVLALGVVILCERLQLGWLANLRVLMPFLFLGGGIYLAIFSDWDSWPLSKLRPITDTEVLLHKTIALLLTGVGLAALRKRGSASGAKQWEWQNRLIAGMAMVGGGLLFTHVHTNAPYADVAIGVYLNHAAMGTVSLAVAAAMLAQDRFPLSRRVLLLFPLLLIVEAGLLLQYNEDLPWFMGYNTISHQAPHGGLLAHVPGRRAELVFDGRDGRMDVYLLAARSAVAAPTVARPLQGTVAANGESVPITLEPLEVGPSGCSHFAATVPRLRQVPLFRLFLKVPLRQDQSEVAAGRGASQDANTWPADVAFEPWVTAPLLPPLVGAEFVYVCPACVDVRSGRPGHCNMCGMALERVAFNGVVHPLLPPHDAAFRMDFNAAPSADSVALKFVLRRDGAVVKDLRLVHEKLMHLIIVSKDLSWFVHVHPLLQADGSLVLLQVFPHAGDYVLFAEAAPAGQRSQSFRFDLAVGGGGAGATGAALEDSPEVARVIDDYTVSLHLVPRNLQAQREAHMSFSILQGGRPVEDLALFLGALGHCVVIPQDSSQIIHTHAVQLTAAAPPPGGPNVAFDAFFPKPGRYKVWGQFNHHGKVLTADFVVRVN